MVLPRSIRARLHGCCRLRGTVDWPLGSRGVHMKPVKPAAPVRQNAKTNLLTSLSRIRLRKIKKLRRRDRRGVHTQLAKDGVDWLGTRCRIARGMRVENRNSSSRMHNLLTCNSSHWSNGRAHQGTTSNRDRLPCKARLRRILIVDRVSE